MKITQRLLMLKNSRLTTRVLLGLFAALIVCTIFVGLDNATGIIIGWFAITFLVTAVVRNWQKIWYFLALLFVAVLGAIFLSFLYMEVALPLAGWIWGPDASQSVPWRIFHVIITNIILLFTPVGIIIGLVGSVWLGITRLAGTRKRGDKSST
ncbi:MAG: hypothetical protein JXA51_04520 [Dehalococcoidales bacterium]|nr:hypothetical protein [Dehalococcoidales bacterium]